VDNGNLQADCSLSVALKTVAAGPGLAGAAMATATPPDCCALPPESSSASATKPGCAPSSAPRPTTSSRSGCATASWLAAPARGATAMGRTMILGGAGSDVSAAAVRTGPGLGLVPHALIDMTLPSAGAPASAAECRRNSGCQCSGNGHYRRGRCGAGTSARGGVGQACAHDKPAAARGRLR
jgi:hypothetical protein